MVELAVESPVIGEEDQSATLSFTVSNDIPEVTSDGLEWYFTPVGGSRQPITSASDSRYTFTADLLSLTINPLVVADEGNYTLEATNVAGTDSADIFLDVEGNSCSCYCLQLHAHVQYTLSVNMLQKHHSLIHSFTTGPAEITITPENTAVPFGESATFTCTAVGEPQPTTSWEFNGQTLTTDDKYNISSSNMGFTSTLVILDLVETDAGVYTCNVTNTYGDDSAAAQLVVQSK